MGTWGPCFYDLQTNGDHQQNSKEILRNLVGQKSKFRLVTRLLERKKHPLMNVPQAYVYIHPASVGVNVVLAKGQNTLMKE